MSDILYSVRTVYETLDDATKKAIESLAKESALVLVMEGALLVLAGYGLRAWLDRAARLDAAPAADASRA